MTTLSHHSDSLLDRLVDRLKRLQKLFWGRVAVAAKVVVTH
jgi:hypothetical protein